ncbi:MAG: serine/threonine protein kinase [Planctomycetaceae bacterium]|jgi:serine/threonine-protein kinase|nr:serine/threonine protein kinase [Planctomycetaceae bacterium]
MSFFSKLFGKAKLDYREKYDLSQASMAGTMSSVYKARDKKTGEIVALKILDMKKLAAVESRFKGTKKPTEGEIAVLFRDHPYIVKTFEQGLTTDGDHYLIMEYLEGTGLNNVLMFQQDPLDGIRTMYVRQVAEAIQAVHDNGYIHRDICPRNLIFTGDFDALKLTDFGLSVPNRFPFTEPGNRTGTANYMAPELVRRRPTDHRLDVFSFGVTIYEMFTKQLPWIRGDSLRGDTGKAAMTHDQPPDPITRHYPNINPQMAKAIHSCIEADPAKRCQSMNDFLKMIQSVATDNA